MTPLDKRKAELSKKVGIALILWVMVIVTSLIWIYTIARHQNELETQVYIEELHSELK